MNGWLVVVLCALTGLVSFGAGDALAGRKQWADGYETGADDCAVWSSSAHIFRCDLPRAHAGPHQDTDDKGTVEWDDRYMATRPAGVRDVPPAAGRLVGDDGGGEGASGVLAGGAPHPRQLAPPGPAGISSPDSEHGLVSQSGSTPDAATGTGPGGSPSRGYGPYLAAIGRDDPAGWYANLTADPPPPEPGPEPEPAFVERVLLHEALEWRKVDAWHARFMDAFHADVSAWDRFAARWADEARWVLVGARSWPPPSLEAAA